MNVYKRLAKKLIRIAFNNYKEEFLKKDVDIISMKDKLKILDEAYRILDDIENNKIEDLQARINHLCSLEDCDEEFEL